MEKTTPVFKDKISKVFPKFSLNIPHIQGFLNVNLLAPKLRERGQSVLGQLSGVWPLWFYPLWCLGLKQYKSLLREVNSARKILVNENCVTQNIRKSCKF